MHWSLDYAVDDAPLIWTMLLMRQKVFNESKNPGFSLLEQEQLDAGKGLPWEEQVRRSREHLVKSA